MEKVIPICHSMTYRLRNTCSRIHTHCGSLRIVCAREDYYSSVVPRSRCVSAIVWSAQSSIGTAEAMAPDAHIKKNF